MANKSKENSDDSNHKKKVKRQTTTSSFSTNDSSESIPKFEQIKLDHLLNEALQRFKEIDSSEKKAKVSEIKHLAGIIEEYLSGFILLGYSMDGEKVCIFSAENSKDEGAVVDLLRSTFFDITSNRP